LVKSTVVVIKLNPDIIKPGSFECSSNIGSKPAIRIRALRSRRDVIILRRRSEVLSESCNESSISGDTSSFNVKIYSIDDHVSKGS